MHAFNERQYFDRYAVKSSRIRVTLFGLSCLLLGIGSFGELSANDFTAMIPISFYLTIGTLLLTTRKWAVSLVGTMYTMANMVFFVQLLISPSAYGLYNYGLGHNFFMEAWVKWFYDGSWVYMKDLKPALAICALLCCTAFVFGIFATRVLYQNSKAYLAYLDNSHTTTTKEEQ